MKRLSQSRPALPAPNALLTAMLAVGTASLFLAPCARAQVWDAQAAPNLNWSAATNWSTDAAPVSGGAVTFATTATAPSSTTTNVVDTSFSIGSLSFTQTGGSTTAHTTQIAAGQTLTVTGTAATLAFGVVANAATNDSTTVFTGPGAFAVTGGTAANINVGVPTGTTFTSGNAASFVSS